MKHILFVCTGNTCRSSMAEGLLKAALQGKAGCRPEFTVSSAGVSAFDGTPASLNAIRVLKEKWGIDISSHASSRLSKESVDRADYIFTMTRSHKQAVISMFPHSAQKVFTLKEFVRDGSDTGKFNEYDYTLDISDPFGGDIDTYDRCASEIYEAMGRLADRLVSGQV